MSRPPHPMRHKNHLTTLLIGALVTLAALGAFGLNWLWKPRQESLIISGGPFARYFHEGLYPDRQKEIELWLKASIPAGCTKADADRILASSFSGAVSSGTETTIDFSSNSAGSQHTKVTLIFDAEGRIQDVKVTQHWAYL